MSFPSYSGPARSFRVLRLLAVLVALSLVAATAGAWWLSRSADRFETVTVGRADLEATVTAIGTLQPRKYVDVGAQVSGQITRLHVAAGSVVARGDLMVEIDPSVQRATVDGGRAQLAGLRAQLADQQAQQRLARQQLARQKQLHGDNATRMEDLQTAEANEASAQARVEHLQAQIAQTQASLKADEARLGYTRIYAPMSGTVVSVQAREGQTLNATYQTPDMLRIADLSAMTVWTEVSEADVRRVRAGMPVFFTTLGGEGDGAPRRWTSTVRQVLPSPPVAEAAGGAKAAAAAGAPASRAVTYVVLFDVDNADGALMPQMTAQTSFVTAAAQQVLAVPLATVSAAPGGGQALRVLQADGAVQTVPVQLGTRSRHMVEVVSGLKGGERVVTGERVDRSVRRLGW